MTVNFIFWRHLQCSRHCMVCRKMTFPFHSHLCSSCHVNRAPSTKVLFNCWCCLGFIPPNWSSYDILMILYYKQYASFVHINWLGQLQSFSLWWVICTDTHSLQKKLDKIIQFWSFHSILAPKVYLKVFNNKILPGTSTVLNNRIHLT